MNDAEQRADNMVREVLKSQPSLFQAVPAVAKNGENVAEFIKALRDGLTAQYTKLG